MFLTDCNIWSYLPSGRLYNKAYEKNTNFYNFVKWLNLSYCFIINLLNKYLKGLFICKGSFLIDKHIEDLALPNEVFSSTSLEEKRVDIYVYKYLMRDNRLSNFKKIASMYGINAEFEPIYDTKDWLPHEIPHKLNRELKLIVKICNKSKDWLPHEIPHKLNSDKRITKLKKIYGIIKPIDLIIEYKDIECENQKVRCKSGKI